MSEFNGKMRRTDEDFTLSASPLSCRGNFRGAGIRRMFLNHCGPPEQACQSFCFAAQKMKQASAVVGARVCVCVQLLRTHTNTQRGRHRGRALHHTHDIDY